MSAQIHVIAGADQGKVFPVKRDKPMLIGRGEEANVQFNDLSVSRAHCQIEFRGSEVVLVDSGSKSGTYLNGQRVFEQPLTNEDVVQIGNTKFRVEIVTAAGNDTVPPNVAKQRTQAKAPAPLTRAQVDEPAQPVDPGKVPELPAERMHELIGSEFSHYRLGPVLAKGQSGMVFLATDTKLDQQVALKLLWPEFARDEEEVQRFIRAMKTMLPIKHPHLITIAAAGKTGKYCWVAMEYVQGKSVTQVIKQTSESEKLDWRQALRVAVHISRAIVFAHYHKIIHRNITPQNIIIRDKDGSAKLGDLMLAKAMEGKMAQQITTQGHLLGDIHYMAPERTSGLSADVDARSDIYALGATIYALCTGSAPAKGKSMVETIRKIRQEMPPAPRTIQPAIPVEFEKIIMKALAKDPAQRYQKASEMMQALEAVAKSEGLNVS